MQPVLPATAFAGGVPANLSCGFCGNPVQKQFYRTLNRFACSNCAKQVYAVIDRNSVSPPAFATAAAAGLATALAGGAVWATTVHVTHWNIGILAFFIGVAVGKVVHFASGKRRAVSLQWLSTVLAVIGVATGKLALICWEIIDGLHADGADATVQNVTAILRRNINVLVNPFDLVWMGIAAYAAWRLCKPPKVSIAGPYTYEPSASSLQFDTVEPLRDIPPATPPGKP